VAFDEPVVVVEVAEFLEGLIEVFEGGVGVNPEELFLEGAPEAFEAAVAFGGSDEGGAGIHAKESQLGLERLGDELGAVVVAEQAARDGVLDASEGRPTGLVEGNHGFESVGLDRGVDAQQLACAVIVDAKDRGLLTADDELLVASVPHI
jgi:hypothetical protein